MSSSRSGKRVLITGITGFVGPLLAKKLLEYEYEIYGLVRRRAEGHNYKRLVETGILKEIKLIEGDLTNLTSLLFALDKSEPDIIFSSCFSKFCPPFIC